MNNRTIRFLLAGLALGILLFAGGDFSVLLYSLIAIILILWWIDRARDRKIREDHYRRAALEQAVKRKMEQEMQKLGTRWAREDWIRREKEQLKKLANKPFGHEAQEMLEMLDLYEQDMRDIEDGKYD